MLRADFDPSYFRRFLWIGLGCLLFGCLCLYDAFIAYPADRERAAVFEAIKDEMKEKGHIEEVGNMWRAYAEKQDWPIELPEKSAKEINDSIGTQFFMFIICAVFGVPSLIKWYRAQKTWVEGDEKRIRNSSGKEVLISTITKINKRKWDAKGVAVIHHSPDGQSHEKFVMDDYKYDREAMGKLMMFAEANLSDDKITGGKSERQKIKDKEEVKRKQAEAENAKAEAQVDALTDDPMSDA